MQGTGFFTASEFPPSIADWPIAIMFSIFALMFGTLLAIQWSHRLVGELFDDRLPWRHPLTLDRVMKLAICFGAICKAIPRLIEVMAWSHLSPEWREFFALQNWLMNIGWGVLFGIAWSIDHFAGSVASFQLRRFRTTAQFPAADGKRRGMATLMAVLLIAFAVTYIRPAQPYERPISARIR